MITAYNTGGCSTGFVLHLDSKSLINGKTKVERLLQGLPAQQQYLLRSSASITTSVKIQVYAECR